MCLCGVCQKEIERARQTDSARERERESDREKDRL